MKKSPYPLEALRADPEESAKARGQVVSYPDNNDELQIDIDNYMQFEVFEQRVSELEAILNVRIRCKATPSKTGLPHQHLRVQFPKGTFTNVFHRIAAQFVLGSDPTRETMNFLRASAGIKDPIRFFEYAPQTRPAMPCPASVRSTNVAMPKADDSDYSNLDDEIPF